MRVLQISDSQLSEWYNCQRKYNYSKVERLRLIGGKPDYMQTGSVVHKFLEVFYKNGIPKEDGTVMSYSDRIEIALDEGQKFAIMSKDIDLPGEEIQFLKDRFVSYADWYKNDAWKIVAVEQHFTVELYRTEDTEEEEGIQILWDGIIDLLIEEPGFDGLIPVDHKSSDSFKSIRHPSLLSGQFIGYAVAMDTTKVVENKFGLQKSYGPDKTFIRHPITFDQQVLEEWKGWTVVQALKMDKAIQSGLFEPNYKACYHGCAYTTLCYTRPSIREWKKHRDFLIAPPSTDRKVYK